MAPDAIDEARAAIRAAKHVVVFTGAGVSAESGIPTFRDALTGLWTNDDPQRLATEAGFAADPAHVWAWYAWRRARVRDAVPNAAHLAIARLAHDRETTVVTQNVDGLHARAGSVDVIELHGDIVHAICFAHCGWRDHADALEAVDPRVPPCCPACGAWARPAVVWFGEALPVDAWERAEDACRACDVCLVIGTSGLVHPAAGLPAIAKRSGAVVIVVGPEPGAIDDFADVVLRGRAGDVVPALVASRSD